MGCSYITNSSEYGPIGHVTADAVTETLSIDRVPPLPVFNDSVDAPETPSLGAITASQPVESASAETASAFDSPADNKVAQAMATLAGLASTARGTAMGLLGQLSSTSINERNFTPGAVAVGSILAPTAAAAPVEPAFGSNFSDQPDAPVLAASSLVNIPDEPTYDVQDMDVSDIPLPDPLTAILPVAPELAQYLPAVEPDMTLPVSPTLVDLDIPPAPVLDLPTFDAAMSSAPDAPNVEFVYAQVEYESTLLSTLNSKIMTLAADATESGLDASVEAAIYERAAEREALLTHRATEEAVRLMKARGFAMPEATMVRVVQQALQAGLNRTSGLSRDILIQQARLQQANYRFAIETAVSLEGMMVSKYNAAQANALEAAKAMVLSEIAIFNARVQLFSADVQAFGMKTQVFRTRLEAALAIIEAYRAQLEGERAKGEINTQRVAVYRAQIEGVRATVDTYRTRVEAAKEAIGANKARVEVYRSRIAAFDAEVLAKTTEYEAYAATVRSQSSKVQLFAKQVEAYDARVDAFDMVAKARITNQDLSFKQQNEYPLELYRSKIEAYRAATEATMAQLSSAVGIFNSKIRAFAVNENTGAEISAVNLKAQQLQAQASVERAELEIDASSGRLQYAQDAASNVKSNIRVAGQLSGQMAAAAAAAQSVTTSVSSTSLKSTNNTESNSSSTNISVSSVNSVSNNVSSSKNQSASVSVSKSRVKSKNIGVSVSIGTNVTQSTSRSITNSTQVSAQNSEVLESRTNNNISIENECVDRTIISEK